MREFNSLSGGRYAAEVEKVPQIGNFLRRVQEG
jgi:hypothetical protein